MKFNEDPSVESEQMFTETKMQTKTAGERTGAQQKSLYSRKLIMVTN